MSENILIVDDDKEIRDLISLYLEADRFYTDKAADGVEALIKLEEKKVFISNFRYYDAQKRWNRNHYRNKKKNIKCL